MDFTSGDIEKLFELVRVRAMANVLSRSTEDKLTYLELVDAGMEAMFDAVVDHIEHEVIVKTPHLVDGMLENLALDRTYWNRLREHRNRDEKREHRSKGPSGLP